MVEIEGNHRRRAIKCVRTWLKMEQRLGLFAPGRSTFKNVQACSDVQTVYSMRGARLSCVNGRSPDTVLR